MLRFACRDPHYATVWGFLSLVSGINYSDFSLLIICPHSSGYAKQFLEIQLFYIRLS